MDIMDKNKRADLFDRVDVFLFKKKIQLFSREYW